MKRTKQVQTMVDEINGFLKRNKIIDEYNAEFSIFQYLLLRAECYKGFNWCYTTEYGFDALVGTADVEVLKEKGAFIQFY